MLWIAESPPTSGSYFYFEEATGHDHLFRETMRAVKFWPEDEKMLKGTDKRPLLEKFQSKGYFLVDTSPYPVDKLQDGKRNEALVEGLPALGRLVERLNPSGVIIVKSNVYALARKMLGSMGMEDRVLNKESLPFPTHGRQKSYRTRIHQLLSNCGTL